MVFKIITADVDRYVKFKNPLFSYSNVSDQDEGLARISNIVKRQKEIGLAIGDEIDGQNGLYKIQ